MAHEILTRTDNRDIPGEAHLLIYGQKENSWRGGCCAGEWVVEGKKIMLGRKVNIKPTSPLIFWLYVAYV